MEFKHFPVGSAVGTGDYVFRHFGGEEPPVTLDYLCLTAEQANSTVAMALVSATGAKQDVSLEFSTNGTRWEPFVVDETVINLVNIGDKVYFRGNNSSLAFNSARYNHFVMTGKIAASGNIMSMLGYDPYPSEITAINAFCGLFAGCGALTAAPDLSGVPIKNGCFRNLFDGCASLETAPKLPATVLDTSCYALMFRNCPALTTPPALPATNLPTGCYDRMFDGCTALHVYATRGADHTHEWGIPTNGTASGATKFEKMFYNCPGYFGTFEQVSVNSIFYTQNDPV